MVFSAPAVIIPFAAFFGQRVLYFFFIFLFSLNLSGCIILSPWIFFKGNKNHLEQRSTTERKKLSDEHIFMTYLMLSVISSNFLLLLKLAIFIKWGLLPLWDFQLNIRGSLNCVCVRAFCFSFFFRQYCIILKPLESGLEIIIIFFYILLFIFLYCFIFLII